MSQNMTLEEKLERYATLRDTIQSLESEKDELCQEIKEAMLAGAEPECELYRANLRTTRISTYPVERFREVYGDAATLEAAKIDNKRVKELVEAGDLDGNSLKDIAIVQERYALFLTPKNVEEAYV